MLSDEKIGDYVDNRLAPRDRAVVCAELLMNPGLARHVHRMVLLDCLLRGLSQQILDEKVPERLKKVITEARKSANR